MCIANRPLTGSKLLSSLEFGNALAKSISYKKGRAFSSDEGVFEAAFMGSRVCYQRKRGNPHMKVILRAGSTPMPQN